MKVTDEDGNNTSFGNHLPTKHYGTTGWLDEFGLSVFAAMTTDPFA